MKKTVIVSGLVVLTLGAAAFFAFPAEAHKPRALTSKPEISIEIKRIWRVRVKPGITMEISFEKFGYEDMASGTLEQDGDDYGSKNVSFDPERPAEKIIDRDLVPLIKPLILDVYAMDAQFRASHNAKVVDNYGDAWVRK